MENNNPVLENLFQPLKKISAINIKYKTIKTTANNPSVNDYNIISVNKHTSSMDFDIDLYYILNNILSNINEHILPLPSSQQTEFIFEAIKQLNRYSEIVSRKCFTIHKNSELINESYFEYHFLNPILIPKAYDNPEILKIISEKIADFASAWYNNLQSHIHHFIELKIALFYNHKDNINQYTFKHISNEEHPVFKFDCLKKYCFSVSADYDLHEPVLMYDVILKENIEDLKSEILYNISKTTNDRNQNAYLNLVEKEVNALSYFTSIDSEYYSNLNSINLICKKHNTDYYALSACLINPLNRSLNTIIKPEVKIEFNDNRYSFFKFYKANAQKNIIDFIENLRNPIPITNIVTDIPQKLDYINNALWHYHQYFNEVIQNVEDFKLENTFSSLLKEISMPHNNNQTNKDILKQYYSAINNIVSVNQKKENLIAKRRITVNILSPIMNIISLLDTFFDANNIQLNTIPDNISITDINKVNQTIITKEEKRKSVKETKPKYSTFESMFSDESIPEKVIKKLIDYETLNTSGELIKNFYEVVAITEALKSLNIIKNDINQTNRNTLFGEKIKAKFSDKSTRTKSKQHSDLLSGYKDLFFNIQ